MRRPDAELDCNQYAINLQAGCTPYAPSRCRTWAPEQHRRTDAQRVIADTAACALPSPTVLLSSQPNRHPPPPATQPPPPSSRSHTPTDPPPTTHTARPLPRHRRACVCRGVVALLFPRLARRLKDRERDLPTQFSRRLFAQRLVSPCRWHPARGPRGPGGCGSGGRGSGGRGCALPEYFLFICYENG